MYYSYYLKLGSGRSQFFGTSEDPRHEGWIELISFVFEQTNHVGGGTGKAAVSEITVSKAVDRVTPYLRRAAANGDHIDSAVLEITDADTGRPTMRISLTDIVIEAHSAPDGHTEMFTLNFANIEFNYNPIAEDQLNEMLQYMFKTIGLGPTVSRGAHR
jgi:type VI secretion system secreted protein Hcp